MKFCSNCGAQCEDNVVFCPSCGNSFDPAKASAASADPFDHTAEFDPKDISDNKNDLLCLLRQKACEEIKSQMSSVSLSYRRSRK